MSEPIFDALALLEAHGTLTTSRIAEGPCIKGATGRVLRLAGYATRNIVGTHSAITITPDGLAALTAERAWRASPEAAALAELDAAVQRAKAKVEALGYPVRVRPETVEVTRSCFVRLVGGAPSPKDLGVLEGPDHAWLPSTPSGRWCGMCGVNHDEHGDPHPAIVAGGEALRALSPGWYKDGGGIYALQHSQEAAAAVLRAAIGSAL